MNTKELANYIVKNEKYFCMDLDPTEFTFCNVPYSSFLLVPSVEMANELNHEYERFCKYLIKNHDSRVKYAYAIFYHLLITKFGSDFMKFLENDSAEEMQITYVKLVASNIVKTNDSILSRSVKFKLSKLPATAKVIKTYNNLS